MSDVEPTSKRDEDIAVHPGSDNVLGIRRRDLYIRAAVVGVIAGAIAVLFQLSLNVLETTRFSLLASLKSYPDWGWIVLPVIGGILAGGAGYLTQRFAPEASGSGIPHIKEVLLGLRELNWRKLLPVKFFAGLLSIGAGLSLGREGPTVQMGAAVGKGAADHLKLDKHSTKNLIASAAGAGLAAAFNAPLAGFIFVIEELQRELSPLTFGSAFISCVTSVAISRIFTGQLPSFHIRGYPMPSLTALPLFALVGLVAGYAGVGFNKLLVASVRKSKRLVTPTWVKTAAMGVLAGLIGWWLPEAIGGGHKTAESILQGHFASSDVILFLIIIFAVKFGFTILSYSSGAPGGIFAPLLVLGALIGLIFGQVSAFAFPELGTTPAAFAVVGMAAMFTSIVRAPLTGIVLILEMTGNQEQLFALILACLMAYLVAEHARNKPIYEALMEEDLSKAERKIALKELLAETIPFQSLFGVEKNKID
jgi:CIC family chloride channel protein